MKILVVGGISRSLVNFRGPLIRAILDCGHKVIACAGEPDPDVKETLESWGARFVSVELSRAGMSAKQDLRTFWQLRRLMRQHQPDVVLSYTIKPVIWGGMAASLARVPHIYSLITGLGYAFTGGGKCRQRIASRAASLLYRFSLRHSEKVFFQNPDDMREFAVRKLTRDGQARIVNGSGVDLECFREKPLPAGVVFLLIGRLLGDKGIREYAEAVSTLQTMHADIHALLVGPFDPNPASVGKAEIETWIEEGIVDYRGKLDDVRPVLEECSVYVLPSFYREGTPRTVLEAMAMGRPIITTDAPGCRETVHLTEKGQEQKEKGEPVMEGENGFLVTPRSAAAIASAMRIFLDKPFLITQLGKRSREIAEQKYDVNKVNAVMLQEMGL